MQHSCSLLGMRTEFLGLKGFPRPERFSFIQEDFPFIQEVFLAQKCFLSLKCFIALGGFPFSRSIFPLSRRASFPFLQEFSLPPKGFPAPKISPCPRRVSWPFPTMPTVWDEPSRGTWSLELGLGMQLLVDPWNQGRATLLPGRRKGLHNKRDSGSTEKPWAGARILAHSFSWTIRIRESRNRESGKSCSCALIWPESGAPQQKGLRSRVIHGKSMGPALWPPFC